MHQSDIRRSGSVTLRNSLLISIALSFISLLAQSACRLLQPQGVHPVPAPAGLYHLQHVAGDDDDDDDDDDNNNDDDSQMVAEQEIQVIVVLTNLDNQDYRPFWPDRPGTSLMWDCGYSQYTVSRT